MAKVPLVFVDTNVFRDANFPRYRKVKFTEKVKFGPNEHALDYYLSERYSNFDPFLQDPNQTKTADSIIVLPALACLAQRQLLTFVTSLEVQMEAWFQPYAGWAEKIFDAEVSIEHKSGPHEYGRITMQAFKEPKELTTEFLNGIQEDEYWLFCLKLNGAKIRNNVLDLSQALDAHHIWTAKHLNCNFFLTRDGKLKNIIDRSKIDLGQLKIVNARELWLKILMERPFRWPYYFILSLLYARKMMNT